MTPLQLSQKYMSCFFGEAPLKEMYQLLADDLRFKGPFYEFSSAADYINSLEADPPTECKYQILKAYGNGNSACLVYEFSKPGLKTVMAQLFEVESGKISKITLIFDANVFR